MKEMKKIHDSNIKVLLSSLTYEKKKLKRLKESKLYVHFIL